ncbi:DUF4258 domain-containing protein [Streptomyces spiralis]|jgi:hypothetical protein|uniref:DUF4258 domain-containing protein n=1 Tax=Streptomyces TaxID=1883 RepID=UPI0036BD2C91
MGYRFTKHALAQMAKRDVSPEEVGEAIRRPDGTEPHQGRTRYVKGSLCVVVAADGAIVTVLLRGRATTWDDHDVINRAC